MGGRCRGLPQRLLIFVAMACVCCGCCSTPTIPQRQSSGQKAAFAAVAASAGGKSAGATKQLEALLGTGEFVAELGGCCPELQNADPTELLQLYAEQVAVTEVAHGFWAVGQQKGKTNQPDVDLAKLENATWFYTMWTLPVLFPGYIDFWELVAGSCSLSFGAAAELRIFGLPAFEAEIPRIPGAFPGGWPASARDGAESRLIYAVHNLRRHPHPTNAFGDVGIVFSPGLASETAILAPVDTGDYEVGCNHTAFITQMCGACTTQVDCTNLTRALGGVQRGCTWSTGNNTCSIATPGNNGYNVNCSGWDNTGNEVGTIADHRHVLLDNILYHMPSTGPPRTHAQYLAQIFRAMFDSNTTAFADPKVDMATETTYFEADIAGSALFPHGVHFVIGQHSSLFGTEAGLQLQKWCLKWRWPLLWTGATAGWFGRDDTPGPARLLDPLVLLGSGVGHNLSSVASRSIQAFNDSWTMADRSSGSWAQLAQALPPELAVGAMRRGRCAKPEKCVALQVSTGGCVCYE